MPEEIKKGDRVKITGVHRHYWCEGEVLTSDNAKMPWEGKDNWYLEVLATAGNIQGPFPTYTYWKQGVDGGQVELLPEESE